MDRTTRNRQIDRDRTLAQFDPHQPDLADRMVGTVVQIGKTSPTMGNYVIVNPTDVGGSEVEGSVPTFTVTPANVAVAILNGTPKVGDRLLCRLDHGAGRWVSDIFRTNSSIKNTCSTTITANVIPLSNFSFGTGGGPPQTILYTVSGTSITGAAINQSGTASNSGQQITLVLQLPSGSYSIHFYEYGSNACQRAPGITGRFDATKSFTVICPGNNNVMVVIPTLFDIITFGVQYFLRICGQGDVYGFGDTTCYGDTLTPSFTLSASPATICSQSSSVTGFGAGPGGVFKVTGYPFTISTSGSAPSCISDSATVTFNADGSIDQDNPNPVLIYTKYPVFCVTYQTTYFNGLPSSNPKNTAGATVTLSGALIGTGTTNANSGGCGTNSGGKQLSPNAYATVSAGTSPYTTVTVSLPGYQTRTFTEDPSSPNYYNPGEQSAGDILSFCAAGALLQPNTGYNNSVQMTENMRGFIMGNEPEQLTKQRKLTPTGKIRLGFLAPNLNSGGAESVQLQLFKGLDPTVFQFVGLVVKDAASVVDPTMLAQTTPYVAVSYGLSSIAALAVQCDVIVSWMVEDMSTWMGGSTTAIIYQDHFPHSAPLDSISQWCLRSVAAVVGVSSLCSPAWTAANWASKYSVIPNSVDTTRLSITQTKAQMFAAWGIPVGKDLLGNPVYPPVAGSYCRVSLDRRPDAVIRAINLLPTTWHVVLVGEQNSASEIASLQSLLAAMPSSMAARVHIQPANSSSGNVLNAFDVVVSCPSGVTESFGLTAVEALWLGKPVVATPYGVPELYPQYFYGVLLDDTPLNLATAIQLAKTVGCPSNAQAFVQATYTQTKFVGGYTALIKSLIPSVVSRSAALSSGRIAAASPSPNLDLNARIDLCEFADPKCFCASGTRSCDHPDRLSSVNRDYCSNCQSGSFDNPIEISTDEHQPD